MIPFVVYISCLYFVGKTKINFYFFFLTGNYEKVNEILKANEKEVNAQGYQTLKIAYVDFSKVVLFKCAKQQPSSSSLMKVKRTIITAY